MRMFVAVVPPENALEDLGEFLRPRQEAERGFRWTVPDQWHITLAFMPEVPDRTFDDLLARLERAAARRTPFTVTVTGGGAFPNPARGEGALRRPRRERRRGAAPAQDGRTRGGEQGREQTREAATSTPT